MPIQNILFDVYQTIATTDIANEDKNKRRAWETLAEFIRYKYGIVTDGYDLEMKRDKQIQIFYNQLIGKDLHYDFVHIFQKMFFDNWSIDLNHNDVKDLVMIYRIIGRGYIKAYHDMKDLITNLKKEGKNIYAVSYTQRSYTEEELRQLDMWHLFDGSCFSSDIYKKKKHPEFYTETIHNLNLSPRETVMIGDNYYDDVLAPRKVGLQAIWLENPLSSHKYTIPPNEHYRVPIHSPNKIQELLN